MKHYLAAAAIVLATSGAAWSQTAGGSCGDVVNDSSATCPSVIAPDASGSVNSGAGSAERIDPNGSSGSAIGSGATIDNGNTSSIPGSVNTIPEVPRPQGMAPLELPNDPLNGSTTAPAGSGSATGNNNSGVPYSNQGISSGRSGVSTPSIR